MSNDNRLGVNPLSWVDPNASENKTTAAQPTGLAATTSSVTHVFGGGIFAPIEKAPQEELMSKSKVKIKQTMETAEVVTHLRDLASSLEAGSLRAESGENSVILGVGESINFEMKLSRKKEKAKCSLEMEWHDDGTQLEKLKISE